MTTGQKIKVRKDICGRGMAKEDSKNVKLVSAKMAEEREASGTSTTEKYQSNHGRIIFPGNRWEMFRKDLVE